MVSEHIGLTVRNESYYRPVRSEFVEMEDALNAEHVVESVRDIQLCASAVEVDHASKLSTKGFFIAFVLRLDTFGLLRFEEQAILMVSQTWFIGAIA
jgi:hypothetical protein